MVTTHTYEPEIIWTGGSGGGTSAADAYDREHVVRLPGAHDIMASADVAFRGRPERWNPEVLLVAALSECHLLTYLYLARKAGIVVRGYRDVPTGIMSSERSGAQFSEVTLRPRVTITDETRRQDAIDLHDVAHDQCLITRSVNFPVKHAPAVIVHARD